MTLQTQWSMRQALLCLVGSICLNLLLTIGGYWAWSKHAQNKLLDEKHKIVSIVQTGPEKEALQTAYLAELLGLSQDHPTSLYAIDCAAAANKLLHSPLIKAASVRRMPPNSLYIDYEVRKPMAMLSDYKNVAIDHEGYLFPFEPFFSPKEIPELYLGLPPFGSPADALGRAGGNWLEPIDNPFFTLAREVLHVLEEAPWREGFRLRCIDVSNAFAPSLGQREIVLFTEEEWNAKEFVCTFPKILRVAPKDFAQQLSNFFVLRRSIEDAYHKEMPVVQASSRFAPRIIDLRIPQLAFVQNEH
jgi:hypothetical protein